MALDAAAKLVVYDWPGNVRELANVMERAIVLGQGPEIGLGDLPAEIAWGLRENTSGILSYRHAVETARADVIRKALTRTDGNRAAAARILGVHKTHLLNLIKSLGIEC